MSSSFSNCAFRVPLNPKIKQNQTLFGQFNHKPFHHFQSISKPSSRFQVHCNSIKKIRERINTVKNTQKIDAQLNADEVFSLFVSEEVDKVELLYTKFVSLVKSKPVIHTLLPISPKGKVVDAYGNSVDALEDEFFRLTSKEGKLALERLNVGKKKNVSMPLLEFEQDPVQILDAMMPLYLNSQILRALQESLASELASRMNAMKNATDNAVELKNSLSVAYNRERQSKITGEILEIVAGSEALRTL